MNIAEINPYIRLAKHSELPAPFLIKRRIIFDYELIYVEDGEMVLSYDDVDYPCKKGDILLLCPGVPHSFNVAKTTLVQPHIHFDMKYDLYSEKVYICYKDFSEMTAEDRSMIRENIFLHQQTTPFVKVTDKKQFLKLFYEVIDSSAVSATKPLSRKGKMLSLIETLIAENSSIELSHSSSIPDIATHIRSFIRSNYRQNITLEMLEQHFGYSKFYIEKFFKKSYGISVISYRNRKRMEAAQELLARYSVSETADMLGYSSIFTFSKAFRNVYGVSPTQFIRQSSDK